MQGGIFMKMLKRICSVILVVLSVVLLLSVTAYADDAEASEIVITDAKAVMTDEKDTENVLRLELELGIEKSDGEVSDFTFDTVDTKAETEISEFSYVYRHAIIGEYKDGGTTDETVKELCKEALIAKAVPVSLDGNVLILDVYSKDGKAGAPIIEIITGIEELDGKTFVIRFPEKMFSNSETGDTSDELYTKTNIEGLGKEEISVPYLIRVYFGENADFLTVLLMLPLLPLSVLIFAMRYQNVCKIYGFNIFEEFRGLLSFVISKIRQI